MICRHVLGRARGRAGRASFTTAHGRAWLASSNPGCMPADGCPRRSCGSVLDVSRDLLILFIASGGLALPAYFSEKTRWAEHWRRVELEKMSLQKSEADLRAHGAAGAGRAALPVQHAGVGAIAGGVGSAARRADHRRARRSTCAPRCRRLRAATGVAQSTLGEQFAICASYLELMKLRLGERLQVELALPRRAARCRRSRRCCSSRWSKTPSSMASNRSPA